MDATLQDSVEVESASNAPHARRWVFALVVWSLFVWATRIDNIVADDGLDAAGRAWRLALALSFVVPAVAVGVLWWRRPHGPAATASAAALAVWTIGVWLVRGAGIAIGDHEAAFIGVHLVLAAISIALGVLVLRALPGAAFIVRRSPH